MKNKKIIFAATGVFFLAAFWLAKVFYTSQEAERISFLAKEDSAIFVRDYAPTYGADDAKVYLTEFLDPECESCRRLYPEVKNLLKEFEGKVKLVVRYAPFHQNSTFAIRVLEAARKQNKYWETLELLFNYQPQWGDHHNPRPELIFEYLPQVGLDIEQIKSDMNSPEIDKIIMQDLEDLRRLNVRGTPTFFVNGKSPQQFGIDSLRELIKQEIQLAYE